jgi:hypothetical protein
MAGVEMGPSNEPSRPLSVGPISMRHASWPVPTSKATATSWRPSENMVTARPDAMATPE